MNYYSTQSTTKEGILTIGGIDVATLKQQYGTPLYIMDEAHIREQCNWFKTGFTHNNVSTEVIYASKAFLTLAMSRLVHEEGLSLDVVSGGELYTAIKAGYPAQNIYFHGNNKSLTELQEALEVNVGTIIIDNPHEFNTLKSLLTANQSVNIMLRLNPGIEAHTHEYIATTKNDSKFGLSIFDETTMDLIQAIASTPQLHFKGFHSHIGSQIFEESSFTAHAEAILKYVKAVKDTLGITVEAINLGGGFGVRYTADDQPIDNQAFLHRMLEVISATSDTLGITLPHVMIEPGRAIVANAGITLYEVGTTKQVYSQKRYVFVDGSMADHLRTSLYQANYHGVLANRMHEEASHDYTVTGKACESGDIIIRNVKLPHPKTHDLLAVFSTGAYHYSMASNYNRLTRPPVIFVKDGTSRLVVRGETYADLIRYDVDDAQ